MVDSPKGSGEHCTPVAGGCQDTTFSPIFCKCYGTITGSVPMMVEHLEPVSLGGRRQEGDDGQEQRWYVTRQREKRRASWPVSKHQQERIDPRTSSVSSTNRKRLT